MEEKSWSTVCNYWNASEYCNNKQNYFSFDAHVPLNLVEPIGECIYFKVSNVTLENGKVHYPNCPKSEDRISSTCNMKCDNSDVNDLIKTSGLEDKNVVNLYQFWLFLSLMIISWIGQAIVVSVGDTICFELLGNLILYRKK